MDNKVAVLVNSCDAYSDIWNYFFYFVDTYWKDCPYRFYLNSETVSYDWTSPCGEPLVVLKRNGPWSKRVLCALKNIREEYVISILDDSFILEDVRQEGINLCVKEMQNDKSIGCFHFEEGIENKYNIPNNEIGFRVMDKRENYLASAHVSLWRKSFLNKILRQRENPWQFELYATERIRHYKEKVYVLGQNQPSVIYYRVKDYSGNGISGGKWSPNTENLFKKHNLECDFSIRGFYDLEKIYEDWAKPSNPKLSFKDKLFLPITDMELFKEKITPRILKFYSVVDLKGRIINMF